MLEVEHLKSELSSENLDISDLPKVMQEVSGRVRKRNWVSRFLNLHLRTGLHLQVVLA